MKQMQAINEEL